MRIKRLRVSDALEENEGVLIIQFGPNGDGEQREEWLGYDKTKFPDPAAAFTALAVGANPDDVYDWVWSSDFMESGFRVLGRPFPVLLVEDGRGDG